MALYFGKSRSSLPSYAAMADVEADRERQRRDLAITMQLRRREQEASGNSVGGWFGNVGQGLKDMAIGLPFLAKGMVSDNYNALEVASAVLGKPIGWDGIGDGFSAFEKDEDGFSDMMLGIPGQYKSKYYDPLADGDFGQFAQNVFYDDALGTVLDVAGLATLGAGTAVSASTKAASAGGKAAKIAKAGKAATPAGASANVSQNVARVLRNDPAGEKAARMAGLERTPLADGLTVADAVETASTGRNRAYAIEGVEDAIYAPRVRTATVGDAGVVELGTASRNPAIRARQNMVDRVSQARPDAPFIGAHRRFERYANRQANHQAARDAGRMGNSGAAAKLAAEGFGRKGKSAADNPVMATAIWNAAQRVQPKAEIARLTNELNDVSRASPERIAESQFVLGALDAVRADAKRQRWAPKMIARVAGRRMLEFQARAKESERLAKNAGKRAKEFEERLAAGKARADYKRGGQIKRMAASDGTLPAAVVSSKARTKGDFATWSQELEAGSLETPNSPPLRSDSRIISAEEAALELRAIEARHKQMAESNRVSANAMRKLSRDGDIDAARAAAGQRRVALENPEIVKAALEARIEANTQLVNNDFTPGQKKSVNYWIEYIEENDAARAQLMGDTYELRGLEAPDTTNARTMPQRQARVDEADIDVDAPWVPQVSRPGQVKRSSEFLGNISKPGSLKHRGGFNNRYAMDARDPSVIVATERAMLDFRKNLQLMQAMTRATKTIDVDAPIPKGWSEVPRADVGKGLAAINDVLDEMSVLSDAFDTAAIRQVLVNELGSKFARGKVIAPDLVTKRLKQEMNRASEGRLAVYDRFTGGWRALTLNARPAWMVNNIVGQAMLLTMSYSTLDNARSSYRYFRDGDMRDMLKNYSGAVDTAGGMRVLSAEVRKDAFGGRARKVSDNDPFLLRRVNAAGARARNGFDFVQNLQAAISDDWARRIAMMNVLRKPATERANRLGISKREAMEQLLQDETVLRRVEEQVLGDLVDFKNMNQLERTYVRRAIPFYAWLKGMSKRTVQFAYDDPVKAALWYQAGQQGVEAAEEQFSGPVPDFVRGSVLADNEFLSHWLTGSDGKGNRSLAFVTQGMNVLQTPVDVFDMVAGVTGKGDGTMQGMASFNPIPKSVLEGAFDRNFFSGETVRKPGQSGLSSMVDRLAVSTPITSSYASYMAKQDYKDDALYRPSLRNELFKYLGVPARDLNLTRAHKMGDQPKERTQITVAPNGEPTYFTAPNGLVYSARPFAADDERE